MALLNKENKYIKIESPDGTFSVYENKETRDIQKEATDYSIILKEYETQKEKLYNKMSTVFKKAGITEDLYTEENKDELLKKVEESPDCKKVFENYNKLASEHHDYLEDILSYKGARHKYPEMKKKFKDIEASVPNIVCKGGCSILVGESIDDSYERAKTNNLFGETEDI